MTVDVVSDIICPWCFIGKRRLEKAASILGVPVEIRWHPFQLNPNMAPEGISRREYRTAKFGSWEHSQQLDTRVAEYGRQDGIEFRHDLMLRTPNSFHGHMLLAAALEQGITEQNQIAERLFTGYFCRGEDVGDDALLQSIATDHGFAIDFSDSALTEKVRTEEKSFRDSGVQGVPLMLYRGQLVSEGAAPEETLAARLRDLSERQQ